jgi:hypothetical protein
MRAADRVEELTALAPGIVTRLQEQIPAILREIVAAIGEEAPDYAALLTADEDDLRTVAEQAVDRLLLLAGTRPERLGLQTSDVDYAPFEELGRNEWRQGRSLRTVLAAYRTGARVAWRHLAETAVEEGLSAEAVALLAEAIFAFIDELSAASARGYAGEQSLSAGETERQRLALADLLVAHQPDLPTIQAAAARLRLPLSASYAVVLAPLSVDEAPLNDLTRRLEPSALPVRLSGCRAALVPDPDGPGRRQLLTAALAGLDAVIGWPAPWQQIAPSLSAAELAFDLIGQGLLTSDQPTFVVDHLAELLLHRDPALVSELRRRRLAPLEAVPASARIRLLATLRAWLDLGGDRQAMAAALHVHPQTVRYRVGQLRSLLGAQLDDPQTRFELQLALRGPLTPPARGRRSTDRR